MKPGVQRDGTRWRGVLRDSKGKVVWICLHAHQNRDNNTYRFGGVYRYSARSCAEKAK